ncbi:MAG: cell division protein FtsQ [Prevotellaceae bacterium]|nr:cell division protein FtsQ [Prevotellaceae bacterium]
MKLSKIIKVTLLSLLSVGLIVYIMYAMLFLSAPDENARCVDVELIVKQDSETPFLIASDVENLLKDAHVYPKGMLMKDVNTKRIEEAVQKNEYVSKVECYKSADNKLCVKVELRTPIMYVVPDGQDGYFIDAQGKIIPNKNYVENLITASGTIDEKYASTKLAEFGQFLCNNEFWDNQIEQIYVQKNRKGESVIELVPRVGDHIVSLGTIDDYERKLRKLKTFYEKAMTTVGWNKYAKVSLEYGNQIICKKR